RRTVTQAQIRDVKAGTVFPDPLATLPQLSGVVDGYPDYANFYGTGSGYITYPLVAMGMWEEIYQHLRALRKVSELINGTSGKVVHEIVPDGTVYFGDRGAPGDINEIAEFAVAVDLVWRWSGDATFRDEMYHFVLAGMRYLTTDLDTDHDGWPEGNGIAERPGIGPEAVDVAAATWQGLRALAHLATSKGDHSTAQWASERAAKMEETFDAAWWMDEPSLYADSLTHTSAQPTPNQPHQQNQQKIWTNIIPMKVELAPPMRAHAALDQLESATFTDATGGLYLVGKGGEQDGRGVQRCWTVGTSTLALAEANYGRLADHQALRAMAAVAACIDVEMPGAFPEIAPSPDYDPFMDVHDRFMVQQAWATYGISWTVIHNLLGIRPDAPEAALFVVPQIPPSWPGVAANKIRVGSGWVSVSATREGQRYRTSVAAPPGWQLTIGHTLLAGSDIATVTLDDAAVEYEVIETPRGHEVRVTTDTATFRTLTVTLK
ncbi:MAG: glycogen debranching protein, partial [Ktedonobacteraceae bacterium]|nr:glycogen debranching protein [Ktedonobacteraceae bacterium]